MQRRGRRLFSRAGDLPRKPRRVGGLAPVLWSFRVRLAVVGDGWRFPQQRKDAPWTKDMLGELLLQVEEQTALQKLSGGLWHPFRRKWATERKHMPTVDVMEASGWSDRKTMETCYQQADEGTLLESMASPMNLTERRLGGTR